MNPKSIWNSATLMSWASIFSRMLSVALVLPMVLKGFSDAEIAVWYLLVSILGLQIYFEFGLVPTFQRMYSFALGGCSLESLAQSDEGQFRGRGELNQALLRAVFETNRLLFLGISSVFLIGLGGLGSLAMKRVIAECSNSEQVWVAWGIFCVASALRLYSRCYTCYLIGTDHVAMQKRWNAVFGVCNVLSNAFVLWAGGGLFELMLSQQLWVLFSALRDRQLSLRVLSGVAKTFRGLRTNPIVLKAIFPPAWRTALGHALGRGLLYLSNVLIAQILSVEKLAPYLFGFSIMSQINDVALVPFYTRIPRLTKLRASQDDAALQTEAARGMRQTLFVFVALFLTASFVGPALCTFLGRESTFPEPTLWVTLAVAFLMERYGAMHLQLLSTTNRVIWHTASAGYSAIFLTSLVTMNELLPTGAYQIPVSMILGNCFYVPFSVWNSFRSFPPRFLEFEGRVSLPAFFAMFVVCVFLIFLPW